MPPAHPANTDTPIMLYAAVCIDKPNALDLRMATRPVHLKWIEANLSTIRTAGPLLDPKGENPIGSLFVVEAESLEAARTFMAEDPYNGAGLFASVDVRPWRMTFGTFG